MDLKVRLEQNLVADGKRNSQIDQDRKTLAQTDGYSNNLREPAIRFTQASTTCRAVLASSTRDFAVT